MRRKKNIINKKKTVSLVKKYCGFCKKKLDIDYKNVDLLMRFVSFKKKIVSRRSSGNCAKHQRKIAQEIKRARFLSLIPYLEK